MFFDYIDDGLRIDFAEIVMDENIAKTDYVAPWNRRTVCFLVVR